MGTNYYWKKEECMAPCEHCAGIEKLHIGKSSGGWVFALHVYPQDGIHDLPDWKKLWETGIIYDEYDRQVTASQMEITITDRFWDKQKEKDAKFLRDNYAVLGPNGLLRVDGNRLAHVHAGTGTWDCHDEDFS